MSLVKYLRDTYSSIFLIVTYFLFLFKNQFSFNFSPEINTHYCLLCVSLLGFLIFLILYFISEASWKFGLMDVVMFLFLIYFILCLIYPYSFQNISNEIFTCYGISAMLYFFIRLSGSLLINLLLPVMMAVFFLIEVVIGAKQYIMHRATPADLSLLIRGSLSNSGIYSCYLVLNLPICYYLLAKLNNSTIKKTIIASLLLTISFFLYLTKSRTAVVTFILCPLIFVCYQYAPNPKRVIGQIKKYYPVAIASFLALVLCIFILVKFKPASSKGRLFVWKVSAIHIKDNLLTGSGIGSFSFYYPIWQIEYVKRNTPLPNYFLLNADDTHVAMNEYLEILIEDGIIGLLAVMLILVYYFKSSKGFNKKLTQTAKVLLLLICIASLSSYPLHCTAIIFLLLYTCAILAGNNVNTFFILKRKSPVTIGFFVSLSIAFVFSFNKYQRIEQWNSLRNNIFANTQAIDKGYAAVYSSLKNNGKFLLDYGEHLLQINNPCKAAKILEESKSFFISYRTYLATADAYYQSGNLSEAIVNLENLSNLVPYKFYPKYYLTKLYFEHKDVQKGKAMAKFILSMPIKKMSSDAINIRNEMLKLSTP